MERHMKANRSFNEIEPVIDHIRKRIGDIELYAKGELTRKEMRFDKSIEVLRERTKCYETTTVLWECVSLLTDFLINQYKQDDNEEDSTEGD